MTKLRAFLDRLSFERRPPTGPLTKDEASEAEALRQCTSAHGRPIGQDGDEESNQQKT